MVASELEDSMQIPTQDGLPPCAPHIAACTPLELYLEPGVYSWCSCGYARVQPFCDGSHKDPACGTNRKSVKFELAEAQTVKLCRCKHTRRPPYCDGSHRDLPAAATPPTSATIYPKQ
jgi:CDGSH iron-sulfur domain-containing protein 3